VSPRQHGEISPCTRGVRAIRRGAWRPPGEVYSTENHNTNLLGTGPRQRARALPRHSTPRGSFEQRSGPREGRHGMG
jgi:hypothetical protein